ncbi:MAG: sensor domain-containing diguanylate cyclase [Clostridium sp.]|jgi:diguanylate cyclase (GGDEF)-like protein|uniref:sensor domain-containing diguanylate cyclase n=1 Tax=Clostridium sp. TaxID=1506 RepID=UPI0025C3CB64|nr:sensor domain-containing diguanylate cyclase [Clostridium sp.]MCH3963785.1 sensor domain-containing diguanylate cyclase [Clostridium sp.]MCI1714926.1 sensor domain-containing diguanylate cyclase [Clostridium sp.]MCI1798885.1 sensor domain-containing diguanylate cyclase [Clostridium sp.]MCI1813109.1 sensor domain-containing diguanylate cyclase [Clostridium sp.]MCI1869999.1 sensor domain-containing diguanylate cyclase [Clostridium sp.]
MNRITYDILNNISEGVVLLNEKLNVCVWNSYMEHLTNIKFTNAINRNIYELFLGLNKSYFKKAISDVMDKDFKMFFSSAMHGRFINGKKDLNLKIVRFKNEKSKFVLLEFIDVTNQFMQITKLKNYVSELYKLNKELEEKEKLIRNMAYHDRLTGVANRVLFYEFAEVFLNTAKRTNTLLGLMFIDIDKFKMINDTYGHKAGDKVLIKVANMLTESTRKNDVVARYGGDEFLILLPYLKDLNDYKTISSRIIDNKNRNCIIDYNSNKISISMSIGVSFYPKDGQTIDELIIKADKAMYIAKKHSGNDNCICINS